MAQERPLEHYAWFSVAAALATIAIKTAAWWVTGSVGLLSDALESLINLAAALLAVSMLRLAAAPPDSEHPYGRFKAEYVAGGVEGALIALLPAPSPGAPFRACWRRRRSRPRCWASRSRRWRPRSTSPARSC
jgi:hypothetical protein